MTDKVEQGIAARVVSVRPSVEFLGDRENFHFTRNYVTHSETWVVIEDQGNEPKWCRKYGAFLGADGKWYWLWHNFHHTQKQADQHYLQQAKELNQMEEGLWQVIL
jgi:hypothetical protein